MSGHVPVMLKEVLEMLSPRDGDMVLLAPGAPAVIDEIAHGRVVEDGAVRLDTVE